MTERPRTARSAHRRGRAWAAARATTPAEMVRLVVADDEVAFDLAGGALRSRGARARAARVPRRRRRADCRGRSGAMPGSTRRSSAVRLVAACDRRMGGLLLAARRLRARLRSAPTRRWMRSGAARRWRSSPSTRARSSRASEVARAVAAGRAVAWSTKSELGSACWEQSRRHLRRQARGDRGGAQEGTCGRGRRCVGDGRRCGMQTSGGPMSGKVRVYEVAKQLNLDPKQVVGLFQAIGIADVRNHMSSVEPEAVERVKRHLEKQRTHDVVEERIRTDGRVVKRRAIAKPGRPDGARRRASTAARPRPASARAVEESPSQPETNGHPPEPAVSCATWRAGGCRSPRSARAPRRSTAVVAPRPRASARAPASCRRRGARRRRVSSRAPVLERPTDDAAAAATPAVDARAAVEPPAAPLPRRACAASDGAGRAPRPRRTPQARGARRALRRRRASSTGRAVRACPMPYAASARRRRAPASPQPNMPRRVQYDPRAGAVGGPERAARRARAGPAAGAAHDGAQHRRRGRPASVGPTVQPRKPVDGLHAGDERAQEGHPHRERRHAPDDGPAA